MRIQESFLANNIFRHSPPSSGVSVHSVACVHPVVCNISTAHGIVRVRLQGGRGRRRRHRQMRQRSGMQRRLGGVVRTCMGEGKVASRNQGGKQQQFKISFIYAKLSIAHAREEVALARGKLYNCTIMHCVALRSALRCILHFGTLLLLLPRVTGSYLIWMKLNWPR